MNIHLSSKSALVVFLVLGLFILALAAWWVVFMAQLVNEKVEMAEQLGADPQFIEQIHQQEIRRQIMVGTEGLVVLFACLAGVWLIYRALVTTQRNKAQQQNFLMAVTHELKTPLASLKLYLDAISSERVPIEKKQQVLPRMQQDIQRLERLMDNVLHATRFERTAPIDLREPLDLSETLGAVVDRFDHLPQDLPVTVKREISPGVRISGDRRALVRALDAVLDNAFKYHNGERIAVRVSLEPKGSRVVINIADAGIGLTRTEREAIFERFYRVGSELTRSASGSGLGLYIAREIFRAHGGDIVARSDGPGTGTTFRIDLPKQLEGGDE